MNARRDRLRTIRTRLAELLVTGELERLHAEHPYVHLHKWVTIADIAGYTRALLAGAERLEAPTLQGFRGSEQWRLQAEFAALQLESLAAWAGLSSAGG